MSSVASRQQLGAHGIQVDVIVLEHWLAVAATVHDGIDGTRIFQAQLAGHAASYASTKISVNINLITGTRICLPKKTKTIVQVMLPWFNPEST